MKDMGQLKFFLGVQVEQNDDLLILNSCLKNSVLKILIQSLFLWIPILTLKTLMNNDSDELFDSLKYQSAIGSVFYLSTKTRPDICYAVNCVARFSSKHVVKHFVAVKCIFGYLKNTKKLEFCN